MPTMPPDRAHGRRARRRPVAEKVMTIVEHLSELRLRIFIGLLAIGIGTVVGWFLAPSRDRPAQGADRRPARLYRARAARSSCSSSWR